MKRFTLFLMMLLPTAAWAQIDNPGWSFVQRFQGNATDSGTILKSESAVGYAYGPYMNFYGGLPLYFTRPDARVSPGGEARYMNSFGNVFLGMQTPVRSEVADYTSDVMLMLPTGSKDHGLNTGRLTFDWNNAIRRTFGPATPFANLGVGNTIMDTAYFIRPFTTLGLNAHFEGGATLAIGPTVNVGASAYAVRAANTQRIFSRVVDHNPFVRGPGPRLGRSERVFEVAPEVRVSPDVVNDKGFATWVNATADKTNFQVGYGRSANFDYDTLFFGIGYRFGSLNR
jgi:hypothetical protein